MDSEELLREIWNDVGQLNLTHHVGTAALSKELHAKLSDYFKQERIEMSFKIGLVGYSELNFDQDIAKALVSIALNLVEEAHPSEDGYTLVSGYTDMGIPAIGYREAKKHGWMTAGIACKKAKEYDVYPVDEVRIVGDEWGDESETFLRYIDVLVRVGGGEQSIEETKTAKEMGIPIYEFDLPKRTPKV